MAAAPASGCGAHGPALKMRWRRRRTSGSSDLPGCRGILRPSASARDPHNSSMNRPGLKAMLAFKVAVSTVLLWVLFSRADLGTTLAHFRQMNVLWMGAALAMYALMLFVSAWRWRLLLQVQTVDVSLSTLTKSFLVATFFNNFLPSNIGGDVVRVADTAPFAGSKTLATTVVLLDRLLGLIALLAVAAVASVLAARWGVRLQGT